LNAKYNIPAIVIMKRKVLKSQNFYSYPFLLLSYKKINSMEISDKERATVDQSVFFRALGTVYKVLSSSVSGSAAVVEHTLEAKSIGAPMHRHMHEDEISYVLEGQLSVIQNGDEQTAGPGEYIVKPRGIFHTFWNATDNRIKFIEIISPGNFEYYFAEVEPFLVNGPPQFDKLAATAKKYGLEIDPTGADAIIKKYGLKPLG
jgi:quercetin dioxygenase-like cupin family protein